LNNNQKTDFLLCQSKDFRHRFGAAAVFLSRTSAVARKCCVTANLTKQTNETGLMGGGWSTACSESIFYTERETQPFNH